MPSYVTSPFALRSALLSGVVSYSFGGYKDTTPPTRMKVTSVAIATNVATLGVTIIEGLIPVVGALISVQGTQTVTSGGAPNFNVTNVALTGVTINSSTGAGTVTFALTSNDISTTADAGMAMVPQPETAEALAIGSGQQFAMQSDQGFPSNSRDISWSIETPSAPSTFTANLQVADFDEDSLYSTVASTTATGWQTQVGVRGNFVRVNLSTTSGGTSPTIIAKILI